jgi:Zn-dependent protease with chaperone function
VTDSATPAAPISGGSTAVTRQVPLRFRGRTGEYFRIWIVNLGLTLVTLGIYSAWAKVRTRRHLYGNLTLDGSRFEYAADPVKILIGRLIVAAGAIGYALAFDHRHTRWRNIRFAFRGSYREAARVYLAWPPWFCGGASLPGVRFDCRLRASELLWLYVVNVAAIALSVGLLIPWAQIRAALSRRAPGGVREHARFRALLAVSPELPVQLHHRRGGVLDANAFALPGGAIVVTDELVELAEAEDEITAVLAHELGHIAHRHALRSLLQNVGVGVLIAGALGDFTSVSAASGSLLVLLTERHYSRSFEREADAEGVERLDRAGIPREHLARMLERLAASHGGDDPWTSYLSTHPATEAHPGASLAVKRRAAAQRPGASAFSSGRSHTDCASGSSQR